MIKKSLKYLAIALLNLILLTIFLFSWMDELEMTFNPGILFIELLKIMGVTFLSLVGMRILVTYFRRKKKVNTSLKIKISILLTVLISSYLYADYISKIKNNVWINGQIRQQIANKTGPADHLSGSKGENLTALEYQGLINLFGGFPKLPREASNIQFVYEYDGFLPDYQLILTYDLPKQFNVDTINQEKGEFSRFQSFEIINNKKRVTYSEILR